MVSFPNCKINIGLRITGKRPDGYHDIETVFLPVGWKDAIEVLENRSPDKEISFTQTGLKVPGSDTDNICIKACHLLKKDFPHIPDLNIHLHKSIPMGAGLGGGSADATFTLKLINRKFNLNIPEAQLLQYALQLGSDCPFFLINKPCYATGRGEILEEISLDLSAYKILLVNPGIHINTGWAFANINIGNRYESLKELTRLPVSSWQQHIHNDFEKPVFDAHPDIAEIKDTLLATGAVYAAMTGSGSTVFGLFEDKTAVEIRFPSHYFTKWV